MEGDPVSTAGRTPRLLVFDSSYTLEAIREKGLETAVTSRDLGGFFQRVWTVHPFASLVGGGATKYGSPESTEFAPGHVFVQGKVGRYPWLVRLPALNFLLAQVQLMRYLASIVRSEAISAVRASDPLLMGILAYLVARRHGLRLVVRVNGNNELIRRQTGRPLMPRFFHRASVERAVERFVLSRADLIVAANRDNLEFAIKTGAVRERSIVIPYGVLIAAAHYVAPDDRPPADELLAPMGLAGRPFLLCIGRLEAVKLPDHAIRTLQYVRSRGIDASLLLVGSGSMRPELDRLAAELGVGEEVIFAGERDQDWLSRVIPRAAVVLSPLTGRALTEVALGAAPIVAYDLDWQGELIRSGITGELVAPRDLDAFGAATLKLVRDREYAESVGAAARQAALEMMDPVALMAKERSAHAALVDRAP